MLDDFFACAEGVFERVRGVRGPVAAAFGYVIRQRDALRRFLDDGRLRLENNAAERALRTIVVGRKAWLFFGSGDHAQAAANIFYLELTPKYWARTRDRLDKAELKLAIGHVTVPPPPAEQQSSAD